MRQPRGPLQNTNKREELTSWSNHFGRAMLFTETFDCNRDNPEDPCKMFSTPLEVTNLATT